QISGTAQGGDFVGVHAHGVSDGGGVSANAQGVPMNVDMLDVNSGGEGFKRIVIEAVQRGHQTQVLGDALRDRLRQGMILNRKRDEAAEQFKGVESATCVERFAGASAKSDDAAKTSSGFQRSEALEEFGSDVTVRTQEHRVGRRIENDGDARRGEGVYVFWEERNEG